MLITCLAQGDIFRIEIHHVLLFWKSVVNDSNKTTNVRNKLAAWSSVQRETMMHWREKVPVLEIRVNGLTIEVKKCLNLPNSCCF